MDVKRLSGSPPLTTGSKDERLYRFLVESLTEYAVFAVAPDGTIVTWNSGAEQTFGYPEAEVVGRNFGLIFTEEDVAAGAPASELKTSLTGEKIDHDRWHVRKDGSRFWGTNSVEPMYDKDGQLLGFTKLVRDITESHLAGQALSDSEERLRLLVESVHDYAIFSLASNGVITTWNSGAQKAFGYADTEVLGQDYALLYTLEDRVAGLPLLGLTDAAANGHHSEERWLLRKDGTRFLASGKMTQIQRGHNGERRGFVKVCHDITEVSEAAEAVRMRAYHDELTKLPNRALVCDHLQRAIAYKKRHPASQFALLFIDFDRFKVVNDVFGHSLADELLRCTARRLEGCLRAEDVVGRIGGDEFVVLLNGIHGLDDADDIAERIRLDVARPLVIDGHELAITVSIGIAMGLVNYTAAEEVLRDADAAMYEAKKAGRARSVVFIASMTDGEATGLDLEMDLRHAVERHELRVEYQPVMRLQSNQIIGFEALVRWQHPRRGLLQPADFIPKAEETDLILPIDNWVLTEACRQLGSWQRQFGPRTPLEMSVNLSTKEFSHLSLLGEIRGVLERSAVDRNSLRLEITESAIMEKSERTSALLSDITRLGVQLYIDDFGTGYSSLGSLRNLPVSALKIDRSFVTNMDSVAGSELVRTITNLAHNLGLKAIAEGVETPEQLHRLVDFGCEYGQGFLFSKPLSAEAAGALLSKRGLSFQQSVRA